MKLVWDSNAWEDYVWWQTQDGKVLKSINLLIQDVVRNGNDGIGKPDSPEHWPQEWAYRFVGAAVRERQQANESATRW